MDRLETGEPAPVRRDALTGVRLAESLPQERLAPVGQLPVRALDLPEERGQVLVAGVLGVLEAGRARVRPLEGVLEDADNIVMLISGADRAVARSHLSPFQRHGSLIGAPAAQPRDDHHSSAGRRSAPWGACPPRGPAWTGHPHPPHNVAHVAKTLHRLSRDQGASRRSRVRASVHSCSQRACNWMTWFGAAP
jgi:hypothetical protein